MKKHQHLYRIFEFILILLFFVIPPFLQTLVSPIDNSTISFNLSTVLFKLITSFLLIMFLLFINTDKTTNQIKNYFFDLKNTFTRKNLRISFIAFLIIYYFYYIFSYIPVKDTSKIIFPKTLSTVEIVLFVFQFIVFVFYEEILYRKYIVTRLTEFFPKKTFYQFIAIFISAILFSLGHYYLGYISMIFAFLSGLVFSLVYAKTNNILFSCIPHIMYNLLIFFSQTRQLK